MSRLIFKSYRHYPNKELNIAEVFKETIIKAYKMYPNETQRQLAARLGITHKQLPILCRQFGINRKQLCLQ